MSRVHTYQLRRGIIYLYEDNDVRRLQDPVKTIFVKRLTSGDTTSDTRTHEECNNGTAAAGRVLSSIIPYDVMLLLFCL